MNTKKREKLKNAKALFEKGLTILSAVLDDEQDCCDNMPDNLQGSDRYDKMEKAIGHLEDAISDAESSIEHIDSACE